VLGRAAVDQAMSTAAAIARDRGATVSAALLVDGEAAEALIEMATERDADLIVTGARRHHAHGTPARNRRDRSGAPWPV